MKKEQFEVLLKQLKMCQKCMQYNCKEKNLINLYKDLTFAKNIPSIWTDWFQHLNSKFMIIGQDWGPFIDMNELNKKLLPDKSNWKELIESEKSHTKKLLEKNIEQSSNGKHTLREAFITNAIMCARQGVSYRGNNINLKQSTLNCCDYLKKQIDIVKPIVLVPLGYYPLVALSKIYNFKIKKNLKETIETSSIIKIENYVIIPLYHPVAQIKKNEQLKQYNKIWEYIN